MANPIFNMLNKQSNMMNRPQMGSPQMSLMDNLKALQSNPFQFLMQRKLNIPNGMNDPQQIAQYWLSNGTMSQEQLTQLQGKVSQMMGQR